MTGRWSWLLSLALLSLACGDNQVSDCADAAARVGRHVCEHRVTDDSAWRQLSRETSAIDQARTSKYLVPATASARLPTLVMDVNSYDTHYQLLVDAFGDRFPGLTLAEYVQIITHPEARELYAGSITEYLLAGGGRLFGYVVWDDQLGADSSISCDQFQAVHQALAGQFAVGELAAIPSSGWQREVLADCAVPSHDPSAAVEYEAYSVAVGYGTVRRYTVAELGAATARGELGFQDIVVVDQAPLDIETVISGAVTGTRQGELSHLNVRATARGTPNCYLRDAHARFADWDGQLVRLECGASGLTVEQATRADAEAWWAALRPEPVVVPEPDLAWTDFEGLLEVATATPAERATALARYGAKGANLAVLYQRIDPALQLAGFLVPMHYYDAFMADNGWTVDLGSGPETLSFADTVDRYLADSEFLSDGAVRRTRLTALQGAMRAASCDAELLAAVDARIRAVFGGAGVMVRFRSSSNAEDSLQFNGAGLYDSTSVCLADDGDGDDLGPSLCDVDKSSERGVCRGLTRVWSSLWEPKAFEERSWFGIAHRDVAMGILVNTRSKNERANIVAFTGDPNRPQDRRYLVNAQIGELDVVSAEPGVYPEKNLVTLADGAVTAIERVRPSTEVPAGQRVLSDAQLEQLGAAFAIIEGVYPVDAALPDDASLLLDSEWKLLEDGRLIIKQVRPFAAR